MVRCAFSGRLIDLACPGWIRTPDGKVVYAQYYDGYLERLRQTAPVAPPTEVSVVQEVESSATGEVVLGAQVGAQDALAASSPKRRAQSPKKVQDESPALEEDQRA